MRFAAILHDTVAVQQGKFINFHFQHRANHHQLMLTALERKSMKNVSPDKKLIWEIKVNFQEKILLRLRKNENL